MLRAAQWMGAGIVHISDLCHPNTGRFLSHTELAAKFDVSCSFLDLLKIRMSIPLHWRRLLSDTPILPSPQISDFEERF